MLEKEAKSIMSTKTMKYFIQKKKKNILFHTMLYCDISFFSGKSHIFPHKLSFIFEHVFNTSVILFLYNIVEIYSAAYIAIYCNKNIANYALRYAYTWAENTVSTNENLYTPFYPIDWVAS